MTHFPERTYRSIEARAGQLGVKKEKSINPWTPEEITLLKNIYENNLKDFILQGTDTLASLSGLVKTEGRLNLSKSLNKLLKIDCNIPDCYPPFSSSVNNISDTSAEISWSSLDSINDFLFVYNKD